MSPDAKKPSDRARRPKDEADPARPRARRGARAPADPDSGILTPTEAEAALLAVPSGPREVPVLPVRHTVLFPFAILPLSVGRKKNLLALNEVMAGDRTIAVFAQRDTEAEDPGPSDLYGIGTLAVVLRMVRLPDERISIIVQGTSRVSFDAATRRDPFLVAKVSPLAEVELADLETEALSQTLLTQFERIVGMSQGLPMEAVVAARSQTSPGRLADFMASLLEMPAPEKQRLLETLDAKERLRRLNSYMVHQLQVMEVGQKIQESVRETLDQKQREFVLRQQLEAIQKELGEGDDAQRQVAELREKIEKAQMPPEVRREADRELERLARIPVQAAEYTVARTYLEWLCDMPWAIATDDNLDLKNVRKVLDEDHYGLDKIKERILEYLAVRRFKKDARTPILCFAGPPGTGKTSLGMSIARALGRKFVHQSLGGVRDEAEIRGHRRTYIGALPGNILRGIRRAGSRNPLFMLDEIDKLASDFHGDPASALLEVLDPEQNNAFIDHYLDVPFDLSQVMFITTANYLDPVPPALRDRMEVIELTGYTDNEKLSIAKLHLWPKAIRENGLESLGISVRDDAVLKVIRSYTSEAGLRNLARELANLQRRTAKQIAEGGTPPLEIGPERVRELLGPEQFQSEQFTRIDSPGAALGLAWTPFGGEVLTVEATGMPGSKGLMLTGQLGEVMKESAQAALSFIRANAPALGIDPGFFENADLHIHIPAGAIAKDGPSAGITLCTALVSLLTGRKVRTGIAMTGEITLLGRVLPIGGLKEKALAAHRAGIKTVIIPSENQKDLEEVPIDVRSHLIFAPVDRIEQVLGLALEDAPPEEATAAEPTPEAEPAPQAGGSPGSSPIETESVAARGLLDG
jgi:ATP-dependent Lon protease